MKLEFLPVRSEAAALLVGTRLRPGHAPEERIELAEIVAVGRLPAVLESREEFETCSMESIRPIFDRWFARMGYETLKDWYESQWQEPSIETAKQQMLQLLSTGYAYRSELRAPASSEQIVAAFFAAFEPPLRIATDFDGGALLADEGMGCWGTNITRAPVFHHVLAVCSHASRRVGLFVTLDVD
jgi:hypothetical protein